MQKILITGSTGLVGSRIIELLHDEFEFVPLTQASCDITKSDLVNQALQAAQFDLVLHLAAYTNVDEAEKDKSQVYAVNVEGTRNLFETATRLKKQFIYISTEFVFDGTNPPYAENSVPHPIGYYGQTKYEGEQIVKDNAMIVRISSPYRSNHQGKLDFVARIITLLEQKKQLSMVTNSSFTPTYIDDIAQGLAYLLNNFSPSIFHLVGNQTLSPFDAGKLIAKSFQLDDSLVRPTTFEQYFLNKAPRPQYGEIISHKNNFYNMQSFESGLKIIRQN